MSRVLKPVNLLSGVEITQNGQEVAVKGSKGQLQFNLHPGVEMTTADGQVSFAPAKGNDSSVLAMCGTCKAIVLNMMNGVSTGFEKKLTLVGIGYRAKADAKKITLNLGFSHPVEHVLPEDITAQTPSQTEIIISGIDKQKVGQVAADIRAYRPPEPYKGKGVRYSDEHVIRKEAKKK